MPEFDLTAFLEEGFRTTRTDADVLAAQQSCGIDARVAVVRDLRVLLFDTQDDGGLVVLRIEADRFDAADVDAGHGHGGAGLEVADVVEFGRYRVGGRPAAEL